MAIFSITDRQTGQYMVIRARCMAAVRTVAVENAGDEGTVVWRDPDRSKVELIPHDGKSRVVFKGKT